MAKQSSSGQRKTASKSAASSNRSTTKRSTAKRSGSTAYAAKKSSAKKSRPAKTAKPQTKSPAKQQQKKQEPPKPMNNQFWSVMLFAIGILVLLIAIIPGNRAWAAMHNALLGLFGVGVFLVPIILIYTAILIGQDRNKQASVRAIWGIFLILFCSAFVEIYFGDRTLTDANVAGWFDRMKNTLDQLYSNGLNLKGGGLISGLISEPLIFLFDEIGAKIVIILFIFVFIMLLTNKGIVDCFCMLCSPFVWVWKKLRSCIGNLMDAYDEEDEAYEDEDEDDDEAEDNEEFDDADNEIPEPSVNVAAEPAESIQEPEPRFQRKSRRKARDSAAAVAESEPDNREKPKGNAIFDDIDIDIPIFDNGQPMQEDSNPLIFGDNPQSILSQMTMEEEANFDALVEDAAQSSNADSNVLPWVEEGADPDAGVYEDNEPIPYVMPPLSLLKLADNSANDADRSAELKEKGHQLVETLSSFGVSVRITGIRRGPTVTRYEIQPAAGVKISKITALANDIGLNLGGESVRIEAPIPGKPAVGVEVPNNTKDIVSLREILESPAFQESKSKLTFAVGKDIDGNVILGDIAKMPHMIIAGATGSGKSVCTNSIIMSILFHASPEDVKLVLIDPKVVEFAPYDGIPHLLIPVVTNPQKAAGALNWAVLEMERRYSLCAQYGVRDLKGYNAVAERNPGMKKLPQILIMIDEFADLMMTSSKEVESAVIRIAQKARAAGMHLIIATQRPTVDVITGLIKSNVPSRIGMSVKSMQDSRNILDCPGAETLLGNGDLLFYPNGWREPKRVQGCFCSDAEVEAVTGFLKSGSTTEYDAEIIEAVEQNVPTAKGEKSSGGTDDSHESNSDDVLLVKAAELAVDMGQLSTTALQRRLKLGYARAARIVEELESRGIVGPSEGAKPRKVLMSPQELTEWKLRIAANGGNVTH